jgi:hypothetical protein
VREASSIVVLTRVPFQASVTESVTTTGGALPTEDSRPTRSVSFHMQPQEQTQRCWAAVTVSIATFFDVATSWQQCSLVNVELNQLTCCEDGTGPTCGRPWYLDRALRRTGHLRQMSEGTATTEAVSSELENGRPVTPRRLVAGTDTAPVRRMLDSRGDADAAAAIDTAERWVTQSEAKYGDRPAPVVTGRRSRPEGVETCATPRPRRFP